MASGPKVVTPGLEGQVGLGGGAGRGPGLGDLAGAAGERRDRARRPGRRPPGFAGVRARPSWSAPLSRPSGPTASVPPLTSSRTGPASRSPPISAIDPPAAAQARATSGQSRPPSAEALDRVPCQALETGAPAASAADQAARRERWRPATAPGTRSGPARPGGYGRRDARPRSGQRAWRRAWARRPASGPRATIPRPSGASSARLARSAWPVIATRPRRRAGSAPRPCGA